MQQSGPRGGDKLYSPNWFMASAEHRVGREERSRRCSCSAWNRRPSPTAAIRCFFKPAKPRTAFRWWMRSIRTISSWRLGFHYAHALAEETMLDLYFAPVGDPALGPVAYPHRASAMELPQAPLSHHWQDSTHISDDVITVGISHDKVKLEASGFHGAEPGENRWIIQQGAIDSWSTRFWFFPANNWAAQVSVGQAHSSGSAGAGRSDAHHRVRWNTPSR